MLTLVGPLLLSEPPSLALGSDPRGGRRHAGLCRGEVLGFTKFPDHRGLVVSGLWVLGLQGFSFQEGLRVSGL